MSTTILYELVKLNFFDEFKEFLINNIENKEIFNKETHKELTKLCFNSTNFYFKNLINNIPTYIELAQHAINGEANKLIHLIDNHTIDCQFANKLGILAANNNHFKIVSYLLDEGIDYNHQDNTFLIKAAEFNHPSTFNQILNFYDQQAKRPVLEPTIYFEDNKELQELTLEKEDNKKFEIVEPLFMDILFEKDILFKHLIKNNMIHDIQKIEDYKKEYSPYMIDNIDYAELLHLSAKENLFNIFHLFIKNKKDPFFAENPHYINNLQFIKDIAVMFFKYDSIDEALIQEASQGNNTTTYYILKNKEFLKIKKESINIAFEKTIENKHFYLAKKIIQENEEPYTGYSIVAKRFIQEQKSSANDNVTLTNDLTHQTTNKIRI